MPLNVSSEGSLAPAEVEEAYRRYGHSVLRRARALLGDEADAREALQEIFLALLEQPMSFARRSSLLTWLYSATTHHCLNRLRNHRTRARILEASWDPGALHARNSAEFRIELRQLLTRLEDDLAAAAVFHFFDRMSQDEIAEVMGCSRRHVGHLLERLRNTVRDDEDAP